MGVFDAIEGREDLERERLKLEAETTKMARDKLMVCEYRKAKAFYYTQCDHPDRQKGRKCVNLDCPVLFR